MRDQAMFPGERYFKLGASNRSTNPPFSCSHGIISTTQGDCNGYLRADGPSVPGDSGGGCFSEETGRLIAMNVAVDSDSNRVVLMPIGSLMTLYRQVEALEQA